MKNFLKLFPFFYTFMIMTGIGYSQSDTEEWVARYNGTENGSDFAVAIATDGSGNVYVTGWSPGNGSGLDYATIKYNSNGVQQWLALYNGMANGDDLASSIAVDGSGNVYVTGSSQGVGTGRDFATVKYNSSGVEQWVARYNGPANGTDDAVAIAVDNSGNVYVTGRSRDGMTDYDYATIKYNSNGDSVWVARYNGTGSGADTPRALVIDASGNVYVTGDSWSSGNNLDYATVKYNTMGGEQWVVIYNGPDDGFDFATAIAVDGAGNVYVTGGRGGNATSDDYATIKYNSNGVEQWVAIYNGPANGADAANAITVDGAGNVYVTGSSFGGSTLGDYATIKYNSNGVQQWVTRYNGPGNGDDYAWDITIDSFGNVFVIGESWGNGTNYDYATVIYNSNGTQLNVLRYNGPGNDVDVGLAITLDAMGNIYITGYSTGSGTGFDYATIKYSNTVAIQNISSEIPEQFSLSQNYPNPFNPVTNISFDINVISDVKLLVYDLTGKIVSELVNETLNPGSYLYSFDASELPSGVYFYKIETGGKSQVKKMMLLK